MNLLGSKYGEQAIKTFYQGEVVYNEDVYDSGTLKVRIPEIDKNVSDENLPPCYPLFSYQFFRIKPQIGERVFVIFDRIYDTDNKLNQEKRYWNALVISNASKINYDPYYYTSSSNQSDGWNIQGNSFKNLSSANGLFPDLNDVIIRGRNNTDISLRNGEILLRAGRHVNNSPFIYNNNDPAYIQIKYQKESLNKAQGSTKTIIEVIPPDYTIKIVRNDLRVLIKVIDKYSKSIVETFSNTYENIDNLIFESKKKIKEYQTSYPKWEIRTIDEYFDDLATMFPNNTRLVVKNINNEQEPVVIPSSLNIVADHINLLSHKTNQFNLTDTNGQITDESQQNINKVAQRMVQGEDLLEFLELVKSFINNHVHPYHGVKPANDDIIKKINGYNLEDLLNNNIRIN